MYPAFPPLPLDTTAPSRPSLIIITTSVLTWTQRVEVERFYKLSRIILLKRHITKIWIMNETLILHDIIKMSTEADSQTVFNELTLDYPLVPIYTSPGWSEILRYWDLIMNLRIPGIVHHSFWVISGNKLVSYFVYRKLKPQFGTSSDKLFKETHNGLSTLWYLLFHINKRRRYSYI